MGFRSLIETYSELKKNAGLYEGIKEIIGSVKNDKIYNENYDFDNIEKTH